MSGKFAHVLAILVAFVRLTSANFDLYHVHGVKAVGGWPGAEINGWQVQSDNPTCDEVDKFAVWPPRSDLSHGRKGVRCDPENKCSYGDAPWPDVKVIEMHFTNNPLYHFTIYKDRGYTASDGSWRWYLYGTDGSSYGECFAWGDYNWDCQWPGDNIAVKGYRKFRCLTSVDANTINTAYHNEGGRPGFALANGTVVEWKA